MITLDEQIEWVERTLNRAHLSDYQTLTDILATLRAVKQAEPVAEVKDGVLVVSRLSQGYTGPLYAAPAAPQSGWVSKAVDALKKRMDKNDSFNENTGLEAAVQELETLDKAAPGREG